MGTVTFAFLEAGWNVRLARRMSKHNIRHFMDNGGLLHFSSSDEDIVEREIIDPLRSEIFGSWKILCCPQDWVHRYQSYMDQNGIPYIIELSDGEIAFLIPGKHNPHRWKNL